MLCPADLKEDSVNAHNHYRQKHGVPPVVWSDRLANNAQAWADHLAEIGTMKHSHISTREGEGENIYCGMGSRTDGRYATRKWYNEIKDYDFSAPPESFNSQTGHFTQMIWADTKEIGLGRSKSVDGMDFIVARYSPIGNVVGEFPDNVKSLVDQQLDDQSSSSSSSEDNQSGRSGKDDSCDIDYYSDDNEEPAYPIGFKQERVLPDNNPTLSCQITDISLLKEPVKQAHWRTRKDVYIQHGANYIVVHGFYD